MYLDAVFFFSLSRKASSLSMSNYHVFKLSVDNLFCYFYYLNRYKPLSLCPFSIVSLVVNEEDISCL